MWLKITFSGLQGRNRVKVCRLGRYTPTPNYIGEWYFLECVPFMCGFRFGRSSEYFLFFFSITCIWLRFQDSWLQNISNPLYTIIENSGWPNCYIAQLILSCAEEVHEKFTSRCREEKIAVVFAYYSEIWRSFTIKATAIIWPQRQKLHLYLNFARRIIARFLVIQLFTMLTVHHSHKSNLQWDLCLAIYFNVLFRRIMFSSQLCKVTRACVIDLKYC